MLELLRELLHRKPFRPVNVVMRSGERYQIADREKVAIGRSSAYLVLPKSERVVQLPASEIELVYEPRRCRRAGA